MALRISGTLQEAITRGIALVFLMNGGTSHKSYQTNFKYEHQGDKRKPINIRYKMR